MTHLTCGYCTVLTVHARDRLSLLYPLPGRSLRRRSETLLMTILWMTPLRHASFFERVAFFTFTTASSWLASDPPTVYMNQGSPIPSCSVTNPCFIQCIKVFKYINFEASPSQDSISSHRVRNSPVHHATSLWIMRARPISSRPPSSGLRGYAPGSSFLHHECALHELLRQHLS